MPVAILMPALSPTMESGDLLSWSVKEGDKVMPGDPVAEIETDKATMTVEAIDEGVIGRILVQAGSKGVAVNSPIALLLEDSETEADLEGFEPPPAPARPASEESPADKTPEPATEESQAGDRPKTSPQQSPASLPKSPAEKTASGEGRIFASPLARRLAKDKGFNLSQIAGSGPHGRIVKADVEAFTPAASVSRPFASTDGEAKALADSLGVTYREEPASKTRRIIAERLTLSKQNIPHFYLNKDVEIDALLAIRQQINAVTAERSENPVKVSVNDFIVKAVAQALAAYPLANAAWNGASTLFYDDADICVAVATPAGLITPVVRKAQTKSLLQISSEIKDLAKRARESKLLPQEYQGGSFTISNLGMYGIESFSAVINPPQGAILAVGKGEARAVVRNGELVARTLMTLTLSVDHRAIDGAVAAEFLQVLQRFLEQPAAMLAV